MLRDMNKRSSNREGEVEEEVGKRCK